MHVGFFFRWSDRLSWQGRCRTSPGAWSSPSTPCSSTLSSCRLRGKSLSSDHRWTNNTSTQLFLLCRKPLFSSMSFFIFVDFFFYFSKFLMLFSLSRRFSYMLDTTCAIHDGGIPFFGDVPSTQNRRNDIILVFSTFCFVCLGHDGPWWDHPSGRAFSSLQINHCF